MAVYTVHQPPLKKYEAAPDPERFAFVRDGFSFWAFLFGPLWMLRHRMWLVLVGYIVVAVGMQVALQLVGASSGAPRSPAFMLALLVGMEAGTLRRFTLGRRRWRNVGTIVGADRDTVERRFFDSWVRGETLAPIAPVDAARRPRRRIAARRPRLTSSACFRSPERIGDRCDRRLRVGQPALGRQGVRARGARVRRHAADRGHQQPGGGRARGPHRAAGRRRLCRLPARSRRRRRHDRGAQ